jgi:hypothetical protein
VPPYVIFHDSALGEMATYYPQSAETLSQMQGVGAVKLARYGDAFLRVIRAYCQERGIAEKKKIETEFLPRNSASKTGSKVRVATNGKTRRDEVVDLYQQGRGVSEIAEIFNVKPATVSNHLWEALKDGVTVAPEPLLADCTLSDEERARVLKQFEVLGAGQLRPVYEALGETVSYDQLQLLRLYFVAAALGPMPTLPRPDARIEPLVIECVQALPGALPRSGAAKLLVGSDSVRVGEWSDHPLFGRLADLPRHVVMAEIDRLLASGDLSLDEHGHLVASSARA